MSEFGDGARLDIRDGWIAYRIYGQDGSMIPMTIADSQHNRRFVEWVQIHDRYTVREWEACAAQTTSVSENGDLGQVAHVP